MSEIDDELDRRHRQMTQGQQPGGRSGRGPEINPGGVSEPQGLVPPYPREPSDDAQAAARAGVYKAFHAREEAGGPGQAPPMSAEERKGVPATDTSGASPKGVGESGRGRGEDQKEKGLRERGREDTGAQGAARRPTGTSTDRDATGVNPTGTATDSPEMPPGDQGG